MSLPMPMVSLQKDLVFASQLMGRVIDADDAKSLKAQITLIDNKTNTVIEPRVLQ